MFSIEEPMAQVKKEKIPNFYENYFVFFVKLIGPC